MYSQKGVYFLSHLLFVLFYLIKAKEYCIENKSGLKIKISILNCDPYDWLFSEEDTPKSKFDGKFIEPKSKNCTTLYPNTIANGAGTTLRAITNDGSWITIRYDQLYLGIFTPKYIDR
jgi:hypothetical protein